MKIDENNRPLIPPEEDLRDAGYSAVRAGLSMIPIVGGAAVELFQFVLQPSLEKRRMEWMKKVIEAITELQDKHGIELENLQDNGVFIDTVIQATHIAYGNSRDEKRPLRGDVASSFTCSIRWSVRFPPEPITQITVLSSPLAGQFWHQEYNRHRWPGLEPTCDCELVSKGLPTIHPGSAPPELL